VSPVVNEAVKIIAASISPKQVSTVLAIRRGTFRAPILNITLLRSALTVIIKVHRIKRIISGIKAIFKLSINVSFPLFHMLN
jgi:hypothetical protein